MSGSHRPNARDETLRLEAGPEGTQVWWRGRRLLGPSPRDSQLRRLPARPAEQTLYVCISPLLGEGLPPFVQRLSRSSTVLCVEYDASLALLWHQRNRDLATVPLATSPENVTTVAQNAVAGRAIRRIETVTLSGGSAAFRDQYRRIETELQTVIQRFWANRGTEIRLGRRWLANIWKNTGQVAGDLDVLGEAMPSKAVLIGAGPSLDTDIVLLEDALHRDSTADADAPSRGTPGTGEIRRPAIVAIDTALPALAARGVPVDCVVAMDGQLANAADLVPWIWDNSVLIADVSTHPSIVRSFSPGRRAFFTTRFSDLQLFPPLNASGSDAGTDGIHRLTAGLPSLTPRGSVAPSALELLIRTMGVTDLVILGVDFWYHPPRTHARMATAHRRFLNVHDRTSGSGGPAKLVQRPWRPGTLQNGESVRLDGILADQAEQLADVVSVLRGTVPGVRFRQFPNRGLPIGAEEISRQELQDWFTTPPWRLPGEIVTKRSLEARHHRLEALTELRERLVAQEATLTSDGPVILDAMLDFAWFDLPQWPLAGRTAAAARLHRLRFLRAVRDHRRRVARALSAAGVTPRESP